MPRRVTRWSGKRRSGAWSGGGHSSTGAARSARVSRWTGERPTPGGRKRRGRRLHVGRHLHRRAAAVLLRSVRARDGYPRSGRWASRTSPRSARWSRRARVEWDLVDAEGQMMLRLAADDMLERADYSGDPAGRSPALGGERLGNRVRRVRVRARLEQPEVPGRPQPRSWKDFFDARAFPGRRAMYGQPIPVLEFALLADSVAASALYPLDVDRAFRFLESRKDVVSVWCTRARPRSRPSSAGARWTSSKGSAAA